MAESEKYLCFACVTGGELYPYLKDLRLFGRVDGQRFILYGCAVSDEAAFYKGIFEYDQKTGHIGFESVEEVEIYWTEQGDMLMVIDEFEVIQEGA